MNQPDSSPVGAAAERLAVAERAISGHNPRHYKYFDLVMAGFVTVLLCSNLIGPGKSCAIDLPFALPLIGATIVFGAGNLFFPIGYIFGDILTEVYGYARARRVIWAGFGAMIFAAIMSYVVLAVPLNEAEPSNHDMQAALRRVFGSTWRIVVASIVAFWVGDFVNSYTLAKLKILTAGRFLWMRTIASTVVGQFVDSVIFYPGAFAKLPFLPSENTWSNETLVRVVIFNWLFKVFVEVVLTPVTYLIVGFLKRAEREDYFDTQTNFTPFSLKD